MGDDKTLDKLGSNKNGVEFLGHSGKINRKVKDRISKDDSHMAGSANVYHHFLDGGGSEGNRFRMDSVLEIFLV